MKTSDPTVFTETKLFRKWNFPLHFHYAQRTHRSLDKELQFAGRCRSEFLLSCSRSRRRRKQSFVSAFRHRTSVDMTSLSAETTIGQELLLKGGGSGLRGGASLSSLQCKETLHFKRVPHIETQLQLCWSNVALQEIDLSLRIQRQRIGILSQTPDVGN